ncbi:MAG: tetratricopeptide repeat protein [Deltaproteobacteria bacterium]|nr:tetratricopeptide repeat protein [Deltaproteobacteria bacterium]
MVGCVLLLSGVAQAQRKDAKDTKEKPDNPPQVVVVYPFQDIRHPGAHGWLDGYLQQALMREMHRLPGRAVLPAESGFTWQLLHEREELGLAGPPPAKFPGPWLIAGTVQLVLSQGELTLSVQPVGNAPSIPPEKIRLNLREESPQQVVDQAMGVLARFLGSKPPKAVFPQPPDWESVQALFEQMAGPEEGPLTIQQKIDGLLKGTAPPTLESERLLKLAWLRMVLAVRHTNNPREKSALLTQAEGDVNQALAHTPAEDAFQTARALGLKAEILYFNRQPDQARVNAALARMKNPADPLGLAMLGFSEGISTALGNDMLTQALRLNPALGENPAGLPPFQQGQLSPLLAQWTRLKSKPPPKDEKRMDKALSQGDKYFLAGEWGKAEKAYRKAQKIDDGDYRPPMMLARVHAAKGETQQAVAELRLLNQEYPQEGALLRNLGVVLAQAEDNEEAMQFLQQALEENPKDDEAFHQMGEVWLKMGNAGGAAQSFRQALDLNPRRADSWLGFGKALFKVEDYEGAERALSTHLSLQPDSEEGIIWLEQAKLKKAEAIPQGKG